jgi:hypothetical protein
MVVFNAPGIAGVTLSVLIGFLTHWLIGEVLHIPEVWEMMIVFHVAALTMALFALSVDRCEEPTLLKGYRLNLTNFFLAISNRPDNGKGVSYSSRRVLCFCMFPLAFAPLVLEFAILFVCAFSAYAETLSNDIRIYAAYTVSGLLMLGITWWYAKFTQKWRNLSDAEIQPMLSPD